MCLLKICPPPLPALQYSKSSFAYVTFFFSLSEKGQVANGIANAKPHFSSATHQTTNKQQDSEQQILLSKKSFVGKQWSSLELSTTFEYRTLIVSHKKSRLCHLAKRRHLSSSRLYALCQVIIYIQILAD